MSAGGQGPGKRLPVVNQTKSCWSPGTKHVHIKNYLVNTFSLFQSSFNTLLCKGHAIQAWAGLLSQWATPGSGCHVLEPTEGLRLGALDAGWVWS